VEKLPHHYRVRASARPEGPVALDSSGLEALSTAPPAQYDGPGDRWSPETLFMGAVVDCFALTFRAVATASSLDWVELACEGEGTLDRVDRKTHFTSVNLRAFLTVPPNTDSEKAVRLLGKAEQACLITNSLTCLVTLEPNVSVEGQNSGTHTDRAQR
jgi:organic hydroperoxide reductase OsmC/OhrA